MECRSKKGCKVATDTKQNVAWDTVLSTVNHYGLEGPRIESWYRKIFCTLQTGPEAQLASCTIGTTCFMGVKQQVRGTDQWMDLYVYLPSVLAKAYHGVTFTK
jgi:hypothetical protein